MRRINVVSLAILGAATFLALFFPRSAQAIDVCGNSVCATNATPAETCSSCPEDCGPCPPPLPNPLVVLVNMVPLAQSAEVEQDSEPNLSVNPNDPQQIAGSAFTRNPAGTLTTAPIYVSTNGGRTWTLNNIVPSANGRTSDITLRFGSVGNNLYAGTLRGGSSLTLNILRTPSFTAATSMQLLASRGNVDQPFVEARSFGGFDRLYVGDNDLGVTNGRSATVERSLDANATAPTVNLFRIETRATCSQDAPPVRPVIHPDGTVYSAFLRLRAPNCTSPFTADVVVVRDDNG